MPVVITDHTNRVWAVEQPGDGLVHVGWSGKAGPRLQDVLEFLDENQAKFEKFLKTKYKPEVTIRGKKTKQSSRDQESEIRAFDLRNSEDRGAGLPR